MRCDAVQAELMEYALGELSEPRLQELSRHLQDCPSCAAALQDIREALGELDSWQVEPPDPGLVEKTLAALEKERLDS